MLTPTRGLRFDHAFYTVRGLGGSKRPSRCTVTDVSNGMTRFTTEDGTERNIATSRFDTVVAAVVRRG